VLRKSLLLTLALALTGCWTKKSESPPAVRPSKGIFVPHRIALVIGNANYSGQRKLVNTLNDAADMADAFERLGFDVILANDTTMEEMDKAVVKFLRRIQKDDLAFFYFSGHGMAVDEENYLLPVDFSASSESSMDLRAYRASLIRDKLDRSGARLRVMVLDACRNNPYAKGKGEEGLKKIASSVEGTLIAFATNPGNVARETEGRNSLYTRYLLEALREPRTDLESMIHDVAEQVYESSDRRQTPYRDGFVNGKFYFKDPPAPSGDAAREAWNLVKDSGRRDLLEGFLKEYGSSEYAGLARIKIQALGQGGPSRGEERVNPKDGLTYVWIPPGKFRMGCSEGDNECYDDEKPAHEVEITKGFWMGQTAVTVGAWKKYRAATGAGALDTEDDLGRKINEGAGDDRLPAVGMKWDEARSYCQWSGMRLITEAEYELAARAGTEGARYGSLEEIAWYGDNSGRKRIDSAAIVRDDEKNYYKRLFANGNGPKPVGLKSPNANGLYDILGNVYTWTSDWYGEKYYAASPQTNPAGPPSGDKRVVRGGSWVSDTRNVRASYRNGDVPSYRYNNIGVRCGGELR
jgi:formylglycine-generating enzyme required for sulfatase activity